jgi:hypothetical protein
VDQVVLTESLRSVLQGAVECLKHRQSEVLEYELYCPKQQTGDDFPVMKYNAVLTRWLNGEVVISPEYGRRQEIRGEA